ncbi:Asp23/Gls24 family envelope stress response protein [Cryptosporangium sp. NPDC048952]|uniref:Asp23/Gls24 family envelope stress response protein n=1 Tax=Cryptosporangium sp. NPDC048952 TaxID=3363961 RepID=UPI003719A4CF
MSGDRLPCGADIDELIEQVATGRGADRTAHQETCPHCQAALAEYGRLWAPVHELADQQVRAPDSIVADVLRQIRGISVHTSWGVLPAQQGETRIADRVVAVTARVVTEQVPGVRAALTSSRGADPAETPEPEVIAGVSGISTALRITVAASYGLDLNDLAERIRRAVTDRVRELTGLQPVEVSVDIDDVLAE